jgi:glycosyltransferase involved in cell wall biosynthesis
MNNAPHKVPRIAFVNTHPIQYFSPLYEYLQKTGRLSITAIYLSDISVRGGIDPGFERSFKWDLDLLRGYEARFTAGADQRSAPDRFFSCIAPQLWKEIVAAKYDALVIHGHTPAAMLVAAAAALSVRTPTFVRCDTHLGLRRSALKAMLRRPVMGAFYRTLAGVLAVGSRNEAFYRAMGVQPERIFRMPYVVDNARFITAARLTAAERASLRRAWGVNDDRPVLLFVGKFQRRKRPDDLLRAASLLIQRGLIFQVVFVGSGEMENALRSLANDLGLENVHFAGFTNQDRLPQTYAAADIFVFPSEEEPWGLVVNEAMCVGLPIIATSDVGCASDLVYDGLNGQTYETKNVVALAAALEPLIADVSLRKRMGEASRKMIAKWTYLECREGLEAALAAVRPRAAVAS